MKMWKVYKQTDGQTDSQKTDKMWSDKLPWAFSSGELKISECFEKYSNNKKPHNK